MKRVLRVTAIAFAACSLVPITAASQSYPTKPVRVIVPWPPGGSTDVTARIVISKLAEKMDKQFLIENRGGASGIIGADVVAKSPADGYTLMVHSATHLANAHLNAKLPYDTLGDFVGITTLSRQVSMLVVHPSMPVKTTTVLIALDKKRPREISYGSSGNGSATHLAMELLKSTTGMTVQHIPYKGGGPLSTAILGGEVQATIATIASIYPHILSKRVLPLGVTSGERVAQFPDVPAIAEAVPGYEFTAWVAAFAPKGTPMPIVDALNAAFRKILSDPDVASKLLAQTLDPMPMSPSEFTERLRLDYVKYEKAVKISGAKID